MKSGTKRVWLLSLAALLAASFYPIYMGIRVLWDMIADGRVLKENYPKYVIPYTPIAFALLVGLLLLPLLMKRCGRFALPVGSVMSVGAFFGLELLLEDRVVVAAEAMDVRLEDWQMFSCYMPPGGWGSVGTEYKAYTPVEILMGDYTPAFKLHFYLISLVIILSLLNCFYGFAAMIERGEKGRKRALILQTAASVTFLGLCILACFTAFWRDGNLTVSPLSAVLMAVFFILLGVTAGIFTGSFLLSKKRGIALGLSVVLAGTVTLLMYVGEMILLHGHLYRFGSGFFFHPLPGILLAPVDLCVILAAAGLTWALKGKPL